MGRTDAAGSFGGTTSSSATEVLDYGVRLLDGFALYRNGEFISLPAQSERLVALLAVHHHTQSRAHIASELWPESSQKRAAANLRSALWHLNKRCPTLIAQERHRLALVHTVESDLWRVDRWCDLIRSGVTPTMPIKLGPMDVGELLPAWGDDWLMVPRERHRLHWLQALEDFALRSLNAGDCVTAIETGADVIAADPLPRERLLPADSELHRSAEPRACDAVLCRTVPRPSS